MSFSSWFSKSNDDLNEVKSKVDIMDKLVHEVDVLRTTYETERDALVERVSLLEEQAKNDKKHLDALQELVVSHQKNQVVLCYDGSIYQGEVKDGYPHGYGTIHYINGYRYVGEWEKGLFHGKGTLYRDWVSPPFHGEWKQHMPHGKGSYDGFLFDQYENGVKV